METYNTYQEAKIANPECEIYQLERNGLFAHCNYHKSESVRFVEFDSDGAKCNPADHCMTVEKFLADGYKFVEGDLMIGTTSNFVTVGAEYTVELANEKSMRDNKRYILRAAALEEKKQRTKVEYVKVTDSIFDLRPDFYAGELFSKVNHARDYSAISNTQTLAQALHQKCCYRRIETPITEREAFIEAGIELSEEVNPYFLGKMFDAGCRFVN